MPLRSAAAALALLLAPPALAQRPVAVEAAPSPTDVCAIGEAEAFLDAGGVRARLFNIGNLFWRARGAVYEVPKGEGVVPVFTHGLKLGGLVGDELRFAGSSYGPWEYWPGPLDAAGDAQAALCADFDRIWTVTTADLAEFDGGGRTAPDLGAWPVGAGAPFFVDADGDRAQGEAEPTVALRPGDAGYDPARTIDLGAGERPVVFGAQTAWWVMNDRGGEHRWGDTDPLGVEVRVTAWVTADDARPALYASTFYRYEILNRSADPVEDLFAGLYTDGDLGNFNDDYVHADPVRSMHVFYNGDEVDEGRGGYGVPPAFGIDVLSGAYAAATYYASSAGVTGDPGNGEEVYGFMRGFWQDGTPFKVGGDGYSTNGEPTRWLFSGEPGTFWSEDNADGAGRSNTPADRRGMISAELGRLGPGEEATLDVGLLFAQGGHRLDSVRRLKGASDVAQSAYASGDLFRPVAATGPPPPPPPPAAAPALVAPADGAAFDDGPVAFEWAPVDGATGYRIEFADTPAFVDPVVASFGPGVAREVPAGAFPGNRPDGVYWRVVPLNVTTEGPPSDARAITLYRYEPAPLTLADGSFAFVEVAGPGGADPCGPGALSPDGCEEVGGNAVYGSPNSTGAWVGAHIGPQGPEGTLAAFAPSDFEIRFTAGGSVAYYPFTTGAAVRVPFEVWDLGVVAPGEVNDPSDDVRMIPVLLADPPAEGAEAPECGFAFAGPSPLDGLGRATPRIYAYYAGTSYAEWEAAIAPALASDPEGCPASPETDEAAALIDFQRGRPIQRFVLVDALTGASVEDLEGTVIRFYTVDPVTAEGEGPVDGTLALSVYPNPAGRAATVTFELAAPGPVAVRVVDVLGREVAVLAAGDRPAGTHRAALPTRALASGVYLVVVEAAGARVTRAVTVVR